ncbi:MAG: orotidine-5'-phosphate decarboxylase [Oscillospiraceae bacterium]|jgi:orotidine-5'-phosphate decarboxylase|nr:orotidine-5'-phosphate decarboxylase [Oscillospiraceae bacterium]
MSFDRLQDKIDALGNPSVCGLDPLPEHIPPGVMQSHIAEKGETPEAAADAYFEFNRGLIDALYDIVPAVKPQSAFYELLGPRGAEALKRTAEYARSRGMYVILDAKRGDIGSTAQAYSEAYLGAVRIGASEYAPYNFDAITVNAYLGSDGVVPFLETANRNDKAVFVLAKTSNPSSGELQDIDIGGGRRVYTAVGDMAAALSSDSVGRRGFGRAGIVAGATYPAELRILRERLPHTFFLVPGYGAQGGGAGDVAGAFLRGGGAIVNSSRAIICAWKKTGAGGADYAEAARREALCMRGELRAAVMD